MIPEHHHVAIKNWPSSFVNESLAFMDVIVHGVPLRIHSSNTNLIKSLEYFFPQAWLKTSDSSLNVYWREPASLTELKNFSWDNVINPNCQFIDDFISQRDFLVKKVNARHYELLATESIDDGFFNFLRAILPIHLLCKKKVLFHSSCVVSHKDEAYLFFGPSGAGKTTIAKQCGESGANILGDDMNLLCFDGDSIEVEAATVGQRFFHKNNFGKKYPLKRIHWLQKAKDNKMIPVQSGQMALLLSSFANLFWDQLSAEQYNQLFQLLTRAQRELSIYELDFTLGEGVWEYVQNEQ